MRKALYGKKSHKLLWTFLIVILVLAVVAISFYMARRFQNGDEKEIPLNDSPIAEAMGFELDPGTSYSHGVSEEAIFFYSTENIKIANLRGELEKDMSLPVSQPFFASRGKYALIADKNDRNAFLFKGSEQKHEFSMGESIITASVNESGNCVFVTKGETHRCSVSVYSSKGEELFKWNSGGLYVLAADISNNNRDIAVSALNTDGGVLSSNIIMFSVNKERPFANESYSDEIFAALSFHDNTLYCIGEKNAYIYNGYGKLTGTVDYAERDLLTYNTNGNLLTLAFSGSGLSLGAGDVETYNVKGERMGQFHSAQEITYLDCYGNRIALGSGRVISVLDEKCKESFQLSPGTDLLDFMFFGSEVQAAGISASGAQMIRVLAK